MTHPLPIRAAVARHPDAPFTIEDLFLSSPQDDEVIVQIFAVGICHTDMAVRDEHIPSPKPIVLGHEGAGKIHQVGSKVSHLKPGERVLITYGSCGDCFNCKEAKASYCIHHRKVNFSGSRFDGSTTHADPNGQAVFGCYFQQSSFASYALTKARNCIKLEGPFSDIPFELAAPFACAFQTGAGAIMNSLSVKAGSSIAIFGCGSVGMAAIMASRVVGATIIIAVDLNEKRLETAREIGATHIINPVKVTASGGDVRSTILSFLAAESGQEPQGLDFSLDTTGNPKVLQSAFESLRATGVCGLVGGSPPNSAVQIDMLKILLGRTLKGIIQGDSVSSTFIPKLLTLFKQGKFPVDKLVTQYHSLDQLNQAVSDSLSGLVIKPVLIL